MGERNDEDIEVVDMCGDRRCVHMYSFIEDS